MTACREAEFEYESEPHEGTDGTVRHGVYVPRLGPRSGEAPQARIGASEWRPGGAYRAVGLDGLVVGGFATLEAAAGFLFGRWLYTPPQRPVGDVEHFGKAWAKRVNKTLLAHTHTGIGATVELPGMRVYITVDSGGSVVFEMDSQDTDADPSLATVDDLAPWAAAVLIRDEHLVHVDAPEPLSDEPWDPLECTRHLDAEAVPDVFTQIEQEFDEDRTDLIVVEHRAANDSGVRHSLDDVLAMYGMTRQDLETSDDESEEDGGDDPAAGEQGRPGGQR